MRLTRYCFLFIIYSFIIFFGTPTPLLILQLIAVLMTVAACTICMIEKRDAILSVPLWIFAFALASYTLFSQVLGLANPSVTLNSMARLTVNMALTASTPMIGYFLHRLGIMDYRRIFQHILIAGILYSVIKVIGIAVIALMHLPSAAIGFFVSEVMGVSPTMDTIAGGILRITLPSDFLIPIAMYSMLVFSHWHPQVKILTCVIFIAAIITAFSRFVFLEALIAFALYALSLSTIRIMGLLAAIILAAPLITLLPTSDALTQRFSSQETRSSDQTRVRQYFFLAQGASDHILVGNGFSSYVGNFVRDRNSPYSYEMQWVAIIYQMGLIGGLGLLALMIFNISSVFHAKPSDGFPILTLYATILLSGFTNPTLIGRSAGCVFLLMQCTSLLASTKGRLPDRALST